MDQNGPWCFIALIALAGRCGYRPIPEDAGSRRVVAIEMPGA
jgi:hypothetical protein